MSQLLRLGVAICTFNSADVILDCLDSLMLSRGVSLSIVIADNASIDETVHLLHNWAEGRSMAPHSLQLIETGVNGGFAAGVNAALRILSGDASLDRFWILNPDCVVQDSCAEAFATAPQGFALMGGRLNYLDDPDRIQIDGGTINRWTGVTSNLNLDASHRATAAPDPAQMDFITGASMVASRLFYETAGPMPEDYFLYYEEVDWALQRGDLPLIYCADALVYHRAGTATGSANLNRPASPFSLYFKHRSRLRFIRRHFWVGIPTALLFSIAKAGQLWFQGRRPEAVALLAGSFGLKPPQSVGNLLSSQAQKLAFATVK